MSLHLSRGVEIKLGSVGISRRDCHPDRDPKDDGGDRQGKHLDEIVFKRRKERAEQRNRQRASGRQKDNNAQKYQIGIHRLFSLGFNCRRR